MKGVKWEYQIEVMEDDDFDVVRGYYDWSDRRSNDPVYRGS